MYLGVLCLYIYLKAAYACGFRYKCTPLYDAFMHKFTKLCMCLIGSVRFVIWPSLWKVHPFSLRLTLLSGSRSACLSILKTYSYSRVFALGALLSGLDCESRFINLEIRHDTCVTLYECIHMQKMWLFYAAQSWVSMASQRSLRSWWLLHVNLGLDSINILCLPSIKTWKEWSTPWFRNQ